MAQREEMHQERRINGAERCHDGTELMGQRGASRVRGTERWIGGASVAGQTDRQTK